MSKSTTFTYQIIRPDEDETYSYELEMQEEKVDNEEKADNKDGLEFLIFPVSESPQVQSDISSKEELPGTRPDTFNETEPVKIKSETSSESKPPGTQPDTFNEAEPVKIKSETLCNAELPKTQQDTFSKVESSLIVSENKEKNNDAKAKESVPYTSADDWNKHDLTVFSKSFLDSQPEKQISDNQREQQTKIARQRALAKIKHSGLLYGFSLAFLAPIMKFLYRYKVVNSKVLPRKGKYLLVSNHISNTDPILIGLAQMRRKLYFMAKAELFKHKIIAKIMTRLGAFPVVRGSGDTHAIELAQDLLNDGRVLLIFFEGTRSKTDKLLQPKTGASVIAYNSNTPVIPVCITRVGRKWLFSKRYIHFGEPMSQFELGVFGGSSSEFRNASRRIMDKIREMRQMDLQDSRYK